jgi:putative ABC transport system substrate-binding protein
VFAQKPAHIVSIGFLNVNTPAAVKARADAFQDGLRELGYIDGQNAFVAYRFAEGKPDQLRALAADLVASEVDVIFTDGPTATRYASEATSSMPLSWHRTLILSGLAFVASLARPGGNITGLSNFRTDLGRKRLETLRETVPGLAHVAVIGTLATPGNAQTLVDVQRVASALALKLQILDISGPQDIETAFQAAIDDRSQAALVLASPYLLSNRAPAAAMAVKCRLPTMYYTSEYVKDGGLISYGVSATDLFRRAAVYVDKIVKGAKPGDLPIEQPTRFELIVNLRSARDIGLTIPLSVLNRADEVID